MAKERDPSQDVVLLEGRSIGWAASGRNGGFCMAHAHPRAAPTGWSAGPRRSTDARAPGRREPGRDRATPSRGTASTAASSAPASCTSPPSRGRWRRCASTSSSPTSCGPTSTFLDREQVRAEVDSPHLPRRRVGARRLRHGRPGPAGLGAARGVPRGSACGSTSTRRYVRCSDDGVEHAVCAPRTARSPRAPGGARHRRVPAAAAPAAAVRRAGVRLRADDRAAQPRAARRDRLAQPAGRRRLGQPVPLLPADRRQPHPVGRLRRRLLQRRQRSSRSSTSGRDLRQAGRALLRRRSRSWPGCGSPTAGAASIDTCTRFCAFYGQAHGGRVAYASATPAWASARPGSART